MKRRARHLQVGIKAHGSQRTGKASVAISPNGTQHHGAERRASGNVINGKLDEISNIQWRRSCRQYYEERFSSIFELMQGTFPSLQKQNIAYDDLLT